VGQGKQTGRPRGREKERGEGSSGRTVREEKKGEKGKGIWGRPKTEKEREIEYNSNVFEFEFKI
jgi:hypothetical protein